ncbi:MAG TPA: menaquinone biosynthesis decarboxylase [Nitrospina sp.]|jgi:4-hydroxy-3-polyprenylbenzoate decarboxylase|nr:menaquinone biosynthesis decarboxylase [Nitrospinaceae bacterium]MDP7147638.1 menaquinone biosynthesis decarboxylase [Nitrospinaceae bacterium]MEE1550025.1 menaquinone biosynthesis decarboxylase [Nitrospinaceae bacterium]HAX46689.1 menaquinone biosynthesis decarboxylase [Nitrospina sp.]|tara:strand:+ start:4151 stop:5968 length:1818 start_codon:yes stop_codon:yes gene_type:complete
MTYHSLREFIERLEFDNELVRIKERVSPLLEIAEITDRVSKQPGGGKALLFENVEGSSMPVLINAFGSTKRMNAALGVHNIEKIARDIDKYLKVAPPTTLMDKVKLLPMLLEAAAFPPKMVSEKQAPCQEVVLTGDDVDLGEIPVLQCWPDDAGRFITFPIVVNRSADRKLRNVGLYRMQIYDKKTTGMHWHIHKDGAHFFHDYRKQNKIMDCAVAIGADPTVCYSASAPLPYGIDEFLLAGFIRKTPVPLVKCKTVDLEVPATSEIILEGFIDPSEMRLEGPFGDHTGYYSQDGDYPVFHITAITHRRNPIYLTTIVGKPPQEDFYLGRATERIFLPLMRTQLPEIIDMDMPAEGVFHNLVIVSIDKRFPMQARRLMNALWGMGQMSFVKTIIVVDQSIDVHDHGKIIDLLLNRVDLKRDLFYSEGILDVLNHASDRALYGSKLGIDATDKIEGEEGFDSEPDPTVTGVLPTPKAILENFTELISCKIIEREDRQRVAFATLDKKCPHQGRGVIEKFMSNREYSSITVLIILEGHEDVNDISTVLWKLLNNIDPKRDIHYFENRLAIDVTRKTGEQGFLQDWPDEIKMSDEIKKKVNEKWKKLF